MKSQEFEANTEMYQLSEARLREARVQFQTAVAGGKKVLIKVQAGEEFNSSFHFLRRTFLPLDSDASCCIYDKSRTVSGTAHNRKLFDFVRLHGRLGHTGHRSKKVFLLAKVERLAPKTDTTKLTIFTDKIFYDIDEW